MGTNRMSFPLSEGGSCDCAALMFCYLDYCMLWRCLSPLRLSTATTQLLTPDGFFHGRYQTRDADEEQFKILIETQLRELSFCLVFAAHHCQCSGSALIAHQGAPGWVL